ncbi:MAG TPA: aldo/keto reductase [Candidatus Dormibacteraeota bacterium]|nr:aldo/keto reductase [Candidatus Dormibacteraeota bacterium]
MRYLELDGRRLSLVGLGCWQFGEKQWGYGTEYSQADSLAVIQRALELGVTVFDTAELYGSGRSEMLVGSALSSWEGDRFLATKFLPIMPTPRVMVSHCARSLDRLQVPLVDLYQIHWTNPVVPLARQMEGMRRILSLGMSRYAGVSNFSLQRWVAAERLLGQPVISNQVRYNLLQRKPESGLLDYAQKHSRLILAYSPLAQGALSGRYRTGHAPRDLRRANSLFTDTALAAAAPLLGTLREVADAHQCSNSQVALAYLMAQPQVIVIPGAKSIEQLESNVAAADLQLADDELLALRRAADLVQYSRARATAQVAGRLLPLRHPRGDG